MKVKFGLEKMFWCAMYTLESTQNAQVPFGLYKQKKGYILSIKS